MKIVGERPAMEAMRKRLGKAADLLEPAIHPQRGYALRCWIKPDCDKLEWVRKENGEMETVPTPGVVSYSKHRDGRIGASWVTVARYEFLNEDTLEPLAIRPPTF